MVTRLEQQKRLRKALILVLMLVGGIVLIPSIFKGGESQVMERGYVRSVWEQLEEGGDVSSALASVGIHEIGEIDAPEWLFDEVLDRDGFSAVMANEDFSLMNIEMDGSVEEVVQRLSMMFGAKGWSAYESGEIGMATYTKKEGACNWMMATCAQVQDNVEVVLRIQHA